ncbi:MAG: anthraniloyl-CoA monooxygenase [Chlamydiales bacterium]|jgi:anthraniloyl-CoA monooxygenase
MRIACIGGGPAGLYFSILMKKAMPECELTVFERNKADDTFGWGVVFSDETLDTFEQADPVSYAEITRSFAKWTDIETRYADACITSTGHGFSGLARKRLLQILQERASALGVELRFEQEIMDDASLADADLIVACDGINSRVREKYAETFKPTLDWRKCKFCWLGTDKPLDAFTFIFRENEHGLFQIHAYPFEVGARPLSTWIVECHEDTWKRAGLDHASEEDTVRYVRELFSDELEGHELLTNRSIWRTFPTVACERWHHDNIVLMGDAAHTAHFSIGSGTKLAMEDAIALTRAMLEQAGNGVPSALAAYEDARRVDCIKIQKAAQTSLEWFENSRRYMGQHPLQLKFNLMTRSKRITYDNLRERDPALVEKVTQWWMKENAPELVAQLGADDPMPPPMFAPFHLREMTLQNRVVVSPMCQYSATDGSVNDWHLMHYGARAVGGAGLLMSEMTNVSAPGRITLGCTGIYNDEHATAWRRITDFVHAHSGAKMGIQLGHAGRKGSCTLPWDGDTPLKDGDAWETLAPSALPFAEGWPAPRAMDEDDMQRVLGEFTEATQRAEQAGFDLIEVHMAHGYLLSSFISPLTNTRSDAFGGTLEKRMRFPLQVLDAVRAAWPRSMPVSVRISATDWLDDAGGLTADDAVQIARMLQEHGCDLVDVSTAGNTPLSQPNYGRMYQVPFAERIRHEVGVPVMAVGAIQGADHVNTILAAGRADLCALARPHLADPHLTLRAAVEHDFGGQTWPRQYLAVKPGRKK